MISVHIKVGINNIRNNNNIVNNKGSNGNNNNTIMIMIIIMDILLPVSLKPTFAIDNIGTKTLTHHLEQ